MLLFQKVALVKLNKKNNMHVYDIEPTSIVSQW